MATKVYVHTCPNNKIYIGIAENPLSRWNNGNGYKDNALFFADIMRFGWDNIKHEIIKTCETREEAERLERDLIIALDSENPEKGYNQTKIKANALLIFEKSREWKKQKSRKGYRRRFYW